LKSPSFTAGEDIGKKSKWFIHISGIAKHIACYLQLESSGHESSRNNKAQNVMCSFKMSFGNDDNRFCFTRNISAHKFTRDNNDWGYSKFISIADLYDKKDTLIQNHTVHICVQMEIYGDPFNVITTLPFKRKRSETTLETFSSDLKELLLNKKHSDVEIICGSKTFHAHKLILSARSKVFSAMFDSEMKESQSSQVFLTDIDAETVYAVLIYIYTGKVVLSEGTSYTELIYGAEKYDLPQLKHYCFDKMFECVTDETVGTLAVAADTYNADKDTKEAVKKYCQSNIVTLMKNPAFKKLLVAHPRAFFQD
jgi:speckle-type POZ protein